MAKKNQLVVVELKGGLGNQMFQYAFATVLAQKNNADLYVDLRFFDNQVKIPGFTPRSFELEVFDIPINFVPDLILDSFETLSSGNYLKKKIGLNYPKIFLEPEVGFSEDFLSVKVPVLLKGYFQSYKYLMDCEDQIRKLFSFTPNSLDQVNCELLNTISILKTVAVHVRRGDYVEDAITANFHGSCSKEYYFEALELFMSDKVGYTFVFFSDDSEWVKTAFGTLDCSKIFVSHNKGENSWKDMLLMSACAHNIIANSSFSWWAAWLNPNPVKKIIAPKKWFNQIDLDVQTLLPAEWIKL